MEIIQRGQKPEDKTAQFNCKTCQSVLRAKASEGHHHSDYRSNYYAFKCPVCGATINIDANRFK